MIDPNQLKLVIDVVETVDIQERDFTGFDMPPVGKNSDRIPYFFAFVTLQMCGTGRKGIGEAGCSRIWQRYFDLFESDPAFFDPTRAAVLSYTEMAQALDFSKYGEWINDKDLYWRWQLHRNLGRHIARIPNFSFQNQRIADLEGFNHDPFEKKANLLRMILSGRPERFIDDDYYGPVIDYHVMRVILRTGIFERPASQPAGQDNITWKQHEYMLRETAFSAMATLHVATGNTHNQLDSFFWFLGREVCRYNNTECELCPFEKVACKNCTAAEIRIDTISY